MDSFSHKHRKRLKTKTEREIERNLSDWNLSDEDGNFHDDYCAACGDPVIDDEYNYDCGYCLHEECAKLEDEIKHFDHPFHSLKLHRNENDGAFNCDVCQNKRYSGFTYRCTDCDFKIDVQCALKTHIRLPIHDHKLKLQVGDNETEPSFFCDFCHTRCYSHPGWSFHCKDCNFKIDLDCAQMLKNFKPIQHVSHKHWLIYDACIKARDRKYCAVCRKVCDGATYCCKRCYFFLHKSCAKHPTEIQLFLHSDHPLMLCNRKERERCDFCNLTCQALTFRCDLCNFKIDYICTRMLIELPQLQKKD